MEMATVEFERSYKREIIADDDQIMIMVPGAPPEGEGKAANVVSGDRSEGFFP